MNGTGGPLLTIPEAIGGLIVLVLALVLTEVAKRSLGWHRVNVDLQPVMDALEPISRDAQAAAYAHGVRNGGGRPLDMRDPEYEKKVIELLTAIRDALLRKGLI